MTEPIAVDVPGKPAFARSVPGPLPASAPMPVSAPMVASAPTPAPRVDAPPKSEPPKPPVASTPAHAVAPKPLVATTTPAPVTPAPLLPKTMTELLSRLTKKQLTIGVSAVLSLVAGIGLVRVMFPAKEDPKPTTTASTSADQPVLGRNAPTSAPSTPAPPATKGPTVDVLPASAELPPPALPALPTPPSGAPTAKPNGISPLPPVPPVVIPEKPSYPMTPATPTYPPSTYGDAAKPPPRIEVPPLPTGSSAVLPVAGTDTPKLPPVPPTPPALPLLPGTPATPPATPPAPAMGTPGTTVPVMPPAPPSGMAPVVPPPIDLTPSPGPVIPTTPPKPDLPPIPGPMTPTAPAIPPSPAPGAGGVTPPVLPALPAGPPTGLPSTPVMPPSVAPDHKPDPKPAGTPGTFPPTVDTPKPDFKPPVPDFTPPAGVGTPAVFTKPGGSAEVKPSVPETTPQTNFDVDLHEPKVSDSYESISQEFYNDRRYATALKAFNRNQPLTGVKHVEVPPIHILKKRYPSLLGNVTAGGSGGAPSSAPQWGPVGDKPTPVPARATGTYRNTYVIPAGSGMSLKGVAKLVYGSEQRWTDLYNLNSYRPEDLLPPGTEVQLPADVRPPR